MYHISIPRFCAYPLAIASKATTSSAFAISSCCAPSSIKRYFSETTTCRNKNKQQKNKTDPRVTLIRYHMQHPLMPRPLRLSRGRALRHWTIARAWSLWEKRKRREADLELQRHYQSMQLTMEVLRNLDDGTASDRGIGSRLFRIATEKKGIYNSGSIPIEYARLQTDTPGSVPWNHNWKR